MIIYKKIIFNAEIALSFVAIEKFVLFKVVFQWKCNFKIR